MNEPEFIYEGNELEIFKHAVNWKRYWSAHVRPHLGQRVLEVGAGTGVNTPYLNRGKSEWVCLEPDKKMAAILLARQSANEISSYRVVAGTINDIPLTPSFDSIVYIDVLEHIEDDAGEIAAAASRLRPQGTLIVLSPAHRWLYSPFDAAIGHYRRYSSGDLRKLTNSNLNLISLKQLDSIGVLASMINSYFLKSKTPNVAQILLWDRAMVPVSRLVDPLFFYSFGKSIIGVWRRR